MLVPLPDVITFSKCPAYFEFSKKYQHPPESQRMAILMEAMQKCYWKQMSGWKPNRRQLIGWVDQPIFKGVDVTKDDQIEKGKKLSESILLPLAAWYEKSFVSEQIEGYINLPLSFTRGGHQITAEVPILKLTDPLTILLVSDIEHSYLQLYNSLWARGLGWLVARHFNHKEVVVERMWVGAREQIDTKILKCTEELNKRTEKAILSIADQIAAGVNYPSFTPMCNQCPFRRDCIL